MSDLAYRYGRKLAEDGGVTFMPTLDVASDPLMQAQRSFSTVNMMHDNFGLIDPTSAMTEPGNINRTSG